MNHQNVAESFEVNVSDIQKAKQVLSQYLTVSPMIRSAWLSEQFECEVFLKMENMQPIGSFKIRGATYKISQLSASQKENGVIAASAGNHAQGVAWGSRRLGVRSLIVMPAGAALVKLQNTRALGAEVILEGNHFGESYEIAKKLAQETGRVFIPAFEDPLVIAGQGTVGLEILDQVPDLDYVIGSVGGGGLMAGVAVALKALRPQVKCIGCQSLGAPSMIRSIESGLAVQLPAIDTFADGIAVKNASEKMRKILSPLIDEWIAVDDEVIASSVFILLEKAKTIAEGSGAVPVGALEKLRGKIKGKKVVLIISGGNIDVNVLSRIIDVGLIHAGRRVRVNVWVSDRPGSLARLTELIAQQEANILQAIHDRSEPSTRINETEVALTLETRGADHSAQLIDALRKQVLRLELTH